MQKNFKIKSEVIEHLEGGEKRLTYDYELKGPKGFPKDCGLIIFEYDVNVEKRENLIMEVSKMFKEKTEYEIQKDKIPGFEDLKFEDARFGKYNGSNIHIKLKFKKKWWNVGCQTVIPIKNKIFLIFGNKQNLPLLMDSILKAESFHHIS
ncbi:MAG: hypothetical protein GF353_02620 [Candidatus Lokiarchaeota archaeon]|nr:hypothetical protein [Candidatus Lokiarchaeota archaeon]